MKFISIILFLCSSLYTAAQADSTVHIRVSGLCDMCKARIEEAARGKGVTAATWDQQTGMLTLQYNPAHTSPAKVQQRIADAGHDTEDKKAKDYNYNRLPECCRYRDKDAHEHHDGEEELSSKVMGVVMASDTRGNFYPLAGATIINRNSSKATQTDSSGFFSITAEAEGSSLVISYAGHESREIRVVPGEHLNIVLDAVTGLQDVKIVARHKATYVSARSAFRTQVMTGQELFKAACCNLSESFETNAAVDVSYNDGVTGSKQIQLLGLAGIYSQLTLENMPGPRGLATPMGLNYIPGTWVESIQLSKGTGSVVNGFESMAGQINVELKKPEEAEKWLANVYVNSQGKTDLNLNMAMPVSKNWSTAVLLHDAFFNNRQLDMNKDGFRDMPTGNLFTVMNRWKFDNHKGWMGQVGFRYLADDKTGGETAFMPEHKGTTTYYGLGFETRRYEGFAKLGYVFPEKKYKSFGFQFSTGRHDQDAYYGLKNYTARQDNIYGNFIYQSIIGNTNHKFRTGLSITADKYNETYITETYKRKETVPGAFFEYTWTAGEHLEMIMGLRADDNNLYGFYVTPRFHLRFEPVHGTVIRLSAGKGRRTADILAENSSALVSARELMIMGAVPGKAYGLKQESAWNEGITVDQPFRLGGRKGNLMLDFYRTDFQEQAVADLDVSARELHIYNLQGKSFANSFQAELDYELAKALDLRLAYRLYDVRTTYHGELLQRPFVSKHRLFSNLAWAIHDWKFDYTFSWNGPKRIPYTGDNPDAWKLPEKSPGYVLMNAQVTKTFGNKFPVDVYLGCENITGYYQRTLVLGADDPFGPYFDASLVWGPVSGRMFYTGVRLKIK